MPISDKRLEIDRPTSKLCVQDPIEEGTLHPRARKGADIRNTASQLSKSGGALLETAQQTH